MHFRCHAKGSVLDAVDGSLTYNRTSLLPASENYAAHNVRSKSNWPGKKDARLDVYGSTR